MSTSTPASSWARIFGAAVVVLVASTFAVARSETAGGDPWTFRTRAVLSGSSDDSDPAGFTAYSAVALEAALARDLGHRFAAEVCLRTESREIDRAAEPGPDERLGSLELLPLTAVLQYRPPLHASLHPYAGMGATLTVVWEKSGFLDSLDVPTHFGPALQIGADLDLGDTAVLNFDIRWNALTADIETNEARIARLRIDPIGLGIGVGFRF